MDIGLISVNVILAIIPSVLLCLYVYEKDVVEKEPVMMLLRLFFLGVLITVPTFFMERFILSVAKINEENYFDCFIMAFFIVAIIEEGLKYLIFYLGSWKNKNFDHKYDAIVYAVFVSLGFASLENILYVINTDDNIKVAILRALISVPAHAFYGIASGYFLGLAKKHAIEHDNKNKRKFIILGLLIPVLLHGIFDFLLLTKNDTLLGIFYCFIGILYYISFLSIQKVSKTEMLTSKKNDNNGTQNVIPQIVPTPVPVNNPQQNVMPIITDNVLAQSTETKPVNSGVEIVSGEKPIVKDSERYETIKNNIENNSMNKDNNENYNEIPVQTDINVEEEKEITTEVQEIKVEEEPSTEVQEITIEEKEPTENIVSSEEKADKLLEDIILEDEKNYTDDLNITSNIENVQKEEQHLEEKTIPEIKMFTRSVDDNIQNGTIKMFSRAKEDTVIKEETKDEFDLSLEELNEEEEDKIDYSVPIYDTPKENEEPSFFNEDKNDFNNDEDDFNPATYLSPSNNGLEQSNEENLFVTSTQNNDTIDKDSFSFEDKN